MNINGAFYCIGAVIAWSISAIIVSRGIKGIEKNYSSTFNKEEAYIEKSIIILFHLGTTLLTGYIGLWIYFKIANIKCYTPFSWYLVYTGILTFCIGTFLYYFCTQVYKKAEIASQFSRVKPLISLLIGFIFFKELIINFDIISLTFFFIPIFLLCLGIFLFIIISKKGGKTILGFFFGVLTAFAWASGEFFMKLAFLTTTQNNSIPIVFTFNSLFFGIIFLLVLIIVFIFIYGFQYCVKYFKSKHTTEEIKGFKYKEQEKSRTKFGLKKKLRIHIWFICHGILSIAFAYTFNHIGIFYIGLSNAAMITSTWPVLSLLLGYSLYKIFPENFSDYQLYEEELVFFNKIRLKKITWIIIIAIILLIASFFSILFWI